MRSYKRFVLSYCDTVASSFTDKVAEEIRYGWKKARGLARTKPTNFKGAKHYREKAKDKDVFLRSHMFL